MKRIVICGPPHSGKTVFLANLMKKLPSDRFALLFGAPDGEWHWSNEGDQDLVKTVRQKGKFCDDWLKNILSSISTAEQDLVLVDTGGVMSAENEQIFSVCDGFIILSSNPDATGEWRKFGEGAGCRCVAELDSVLVGKCELYPRQKDGIVRGRITGLERGHKINSPTLDAVAECLVKIIKTNARVTEAERICDVNGAEMVNAIGIEDQSDPFLGIRPWHIASAIKILAEAREREIVRMWNVRASFMACALTVATPGKVELFGVSEGYIRIPDVTLNGGEGDGVEWEVIETSQYTLVKYKKTKFLTKKVLNSIHPPNVNLDRGVVIATDGPPIWLDATIARAYDRAGAPWIGMFVPVESGRKQPGLGGEVWSKIYPYSAPCVVIGGNERQFGEIFPVPFELVGKNTKVWGYLASGELVVDRADGSHVITHTEVISVLPEALAKISSQGRDFIVEEVEMERIVGNTICVETSEDDEIVYAQRLNRRGLTRFVKNRRPKPCSTVMLYLKKVAEGVYITFTAYVGKQAPAEPWDKKYANQESLDFWNSHALVWGGEETISGTETNKCPW